MGGGADGYGPKVAQRRRRFRTVRDRVAYSDGAVYGFEIRGFVSRHGQVGGVGAEMAGVARRLIGPAGGELRDLDLMDAQVRKAISAAEEVQTL